MISFFHPVDKFLMTTLVLNSFSLFCLLVFLMSRGVYLAGDKCPKREALKHNFQPWYFLDRGETIQVWAELIPEPWEDNRLVGSLADTKYLTFNLTSSQSSSALGGSGVIYRNVTALIKQRYSNKTIEQEIRTSQSCAILFKMESFSEDPSCPTLKAEANITVGCPPTRHIQVRGKPNKCHEFENYSFTIPSNQWRNRLFPDTARSDKFVDYNFQMYECPLTVQNSQPFKPVVDLYDGESFVKEVDVNYILWEQNDRTGFKYSATMEQAGCMTEAQSWETIIHTASPKTSMEMAWSKENYQSCFQTSNNVPVHLMDLQQEYQIMNSSGISHILWRATGVFVFSLKIIEPDFSFCNLTTKFAVQVISVQTTMEELPTFVVLGSSCITIIMLVVSSFYVAAFCSN